MPCDSNEHYKRDKETLHFVTVAIEIMKTVRRVQQPG